MIDNSKCFTADTDLIKLCLNKLKINSYEIGFIEMITKLP